MYKGVPDICNFCKDSLIFIDISKSIILISKESPVNNIFSGFKSLCNIPYLCIYITALNNYYIIFKASFSLKNFCFLI